MRNRTPKGRQRGKTCKAVRAGKNLMRFMANYTKFGNKTETEKYFKDRVILKKQMRTIIFLWAIFLLPINLSAQITIAEKSQKKEPSWEYMRDIIMLPYDSTQLYIEHYPVLEAYKKYIGQQIFFTKNVNSLNLTISSKNGSSIPKETLHHKYYEIVDVISYQSFLEVKSQEEEKTFHERRKALNERVTELSEIKKELAQDFAIHDSICEIDRELCKIEEKRKEKVSRKEEKILAERETELYAKKEVFQRDYKKKDEDGENFFERGRLEKHCIVPNSSWDREYSRRERILNNLVEKELEQIKKEISQIDDYFREGIVNSRKIQMSRDIKRYQKTYFFPCEDNYEKKCSYEVESKDVPYFVLKDIQLMDTIYCTSPHLESPKYEHLLVGGFVKLKESVVGNSVVACKHSLGHKPEILSMWECTDIVITDDEDYINVDWSEERKGTSKQQGELVSLVLQNSKNKNITGYVALFNITEDFEKLRGGYCFMLEKTYNRYVSALNETKQKYSQQAAQEKAKRKQQLTSKYGAATAEKIITGKFEIGMNKAVCKEIIGYAPAVIEKTATTETWKISYFIGGGSTFLVFTGDKLYRIINR